MLDFLHIITLYVMFNQILHLYYTYLLNKQKKNTTLDGQSI